MKKKFTLLCTVFFLNAFSQTANVSIPLSQGTGADAYLASGAPTVNYGSHPSLGGNTWTCTGPLCLSRGLFKFDLSSLPALITSASLSLFADLNWSNTPTTGTNNAGYLQRVTAPWTESTVTWSTQPTTTSSNQVIVPASTSSAQNYTLNVTTLVQEMLNNGNNGFMLSMQDEVNYYKALMFASSDNANSSKMPVLNITYSTVGLKKHELQNTLQLFPNPSIDYFHVTSHELIKKVVIHNGMGQKSLEKEINSTSTFVGQDLESGIYFISVYFSDNSVATKRIIKS